MINDAFDAWKEGRHEGYFATEKTYCRYCFFDRSKPLVITFSMMGKYADRSLKGNDEIWSYGYLVNKKINVISFACIEKASWYLDRDLVVKLDEIKEVLGAFPERLGYGGSMGGFAVLAYYSKLKLDRVLVMNPITTLNEKKVPFETRFKVNQKRLNWDFEFADSADVDMNGYIVYDPLFDLDKKHAKRLSGLQELKFPGVGHSIPMHLSKIGELDWLFMSFYNREAEQKVALDFYRKVRKRRGYARYYEWLKSDQNKCLTPKRKRIIDLHHKIKKLKDGKVEAVPKGSVEKVRNLAISLEEEDLNLSYEIMKVARYMRPTGGFIKKKIVNYENLLKKTI